MIATLFRMTEPDGTVKIDGVSTNEIGLHDLRKKISIIPQVSRRSFYYVENNTLDFMTLCNKRLFLFLLFSLEAFSRYSVNLDA